MAGLLNGGGFDDPLTMGLLGASQALMTPMAQGGGMGAAFNAFPAAQQQAMRQQYLRQQMGVEQMRADALKRKLEQDDQLRQRQADFISGLNPSSAALSAGAQAGDIGPTNSNAARMAGNQQGFRFTNDMVAKGLAAGYDPKDISSLSQLMSGEAVGAEFGLVPQVGVNPKTGQRELFVQDKRGSTKWLGVAKPDDVNLQYVPPVPATDYTPGRPGGIFNSRTGQMTPELQPLAAPGMPAPQMPQQDSNAPWAGLPPKRADDVRVRENERIRKDLDDARDALRAEGVSIGKMNQFGALNKRTATGDALSIYTPGVSSFLSDDTSQMRSISSSLAPRERVPGSGTSTDKDIALFIQAVPSIDKPGPVNQAIREARKAQFQRDNDYLNSKENFFAKFGHVNGFDQQWSKYSTDVPVFSEDATPNDFKLNTGRISFSDWASGSRPKANTRQQSAPRQQGLGTGNVAGSIGALPSVTEADIVATVAAMRNKDPNVTRDQVIEMMRRKGMKIDSPMVRNADIR
jgi:hypothetical protein